MHAPYQLRAQEPLVRPLTLQNRLVCVDPLLRAARGASSAIRLRVSD